MLEKYCPEKQLRRPTEIKNKDLVPSELNFKEAGQINNRLKHINDLFKDKEIDLSTYKTTGNRILNNLPDGNEYLSFLNEKIKNNQACIPILEGQISRIHEHNHTDHINYSYIDHLSKKIKKLEQEKRKSMADLFNYQEYLSWKNKIEILSPDQPTK